VIDLNERIVTPKMMQTMDQALMTRKKMDENSLTEEVGKRLYEAIIHDFGSEEIKWVCFSGPGNNGADALHLTRFLHLNGRDVTLYVLKKAKEEPIKMCEQANIQIHVLDDDNSAFTIPSEAIVIDGIFGSGLNRNLSPFFQSIIGTINKRAKQVIAIDLPSGIHGETGMKMPVAINAIKTYVIGLLKSGNLLFDAPDYHGEKQIIDIGFDQTDLPDGVWHRLQGEPRFIKRRKNTHKYDYGKAVFVGGEKHMPGAITMAAHAAMRSGLGVAKILMRQEDFDHYSPWIPEIILGSFAGSDYEEHFKKTDAVCFGPGMDVDDTIYERMLDYLLNEKIPVVVDAGGLQHIPSLLKENEELPMILTPHYGEFKRLLDKCDLHFDTLADCIRFFISKKITLVLKGNATIIAGEERVFIVEGNNPGLATAGSGDVLAGMITSYLAQGLSMQQSAINAVLLHIRVGKYAKETYGETSMMATDLIKKIPFVFKRKEDKRK